MSYTVANSAPNGLVVGDFNDDGIPDLAVGGATVNLLLGRGDGTFQNGAAPAIAGDAGILSGDFDGDGLTDLVLASGATVTVALGRGDGTFQQKAVYTLASAVVSMVAGDFNGDGVADVAVFSANTLNVFLGSGDGSLRTPLTSSTFGYPPATYLATADFNGDGKLDVMTAGSTGGCGLGGATGSFTLYASHGDGTFQPTVAYSNCYPVSGGIPFGGVAAADLNGDGKPDILFFTNGGNPNVASILNHGDGTFQQTQTGFTAPFNVSAIVAGDWNGDGVPDVAVASGGVNGNPAPAVYTLVGASANLSVAVAGVGNFIPGQTASVQITVSNAAGGTASGGAVRVAATLPTSLNLTSVTGAGWTCTGLNCSRTDSLAAGASFPPIVINVSVSTASQPSYTVSASLTGGSSAPGSDTSVIPRSSLPGTPILTGPENGAELFATQVTLSWTHGQQATTEDLYLGTTSPPPFLVTNVPGGGYLPTGLQGGTTYYWQVVDRNSSGSSPSAIGSFSTYPQCAALVPLPQLLSPAAQTDVVGVQAVFGCAWTATSSVPWITLTSASGTGNGQVSFSVAANTGAPRIGTISVQGTSVTITQDAPGLGLVTVTPCRVADTRGAVGAFGGPAMAAGQTRTFSIPASACGVPAAQVYSLNITVVPHGTLNYLTVWPSNATQPFVSTLNSYNGAIVANAAIVPADPNGNISVYVTDATDVIIDINGYFVPATAPNALAFYTVTPCRVVDTRKPAGTLGGPSIAGGQTRTFPVPSSTCGIPSTAKAYALNITVVPPGPMGYLTAWPTGGSQPYVSSVNSYDGRVVANAAIVPAGTGGGISVFVSDPTNVVIDISGYFAPPGGPSTALYFYPLTPCRAADTRNPTGPLGGPSLVPNLGRDFPVVSSSCGLPLRSEAFSLNVTAVPKAPLGYLSIGNSNTVSTLNSFSGAVVANAAFAAVSSPANRGIVGILATDPTDVILDVNGYFAQ